MRPTRTRWRTASTSRHQTVYDERFARAYGPWRPVVAQVADQFLACGVLDHGFARIRCDACTPECLLTVGIVACLQTHGSRANWHPHRHLLVTDGDFRPDGTFVSWSTHDTGRLTGAFRRAVLRLFVRLELFDEDQAAGRLTWPHSGYHVYTAVWGVPFGAPRTIARWRSRRNPLPERPWMVESTGPRSASATQR